LLVLATASASALGQRRLSGWRLVLRLAALTLVAAGALAAVLLLTAAENEQDVWHLLLDSGVRVLVVVVVIGVGWFLGRPSWRTAEDRPRTPA
jgi:chromate transport protein ChrA